MAARMIAEEAAGSLSGVYNEIRTLLGLPFVPNVFKAMAAVNADVLVQNWAAFKSTVLDGALPRWLKEMVALATALECPTGYTVPLHVQALGDLGITTPVIAELIAAGDSEALSPPVRSALAFARACARNPDAAATESLEAAGFSDEEVHELIDSVLIVQGLNAFAAESGVPGDRL